MVRELVTVQVGQCGNQIGRCFWSHVVAEHASVVKDGRFDDAMSSYFRNVDGKTGQDIKDLHGEIQSLKARAICVDTEEGVLSQIMTSDLRELFDENEFIKGVSGAGNNFAHGYYGYGEEYGSKILNCVRRATEKSDSLQAFFLLHSTGGGTGSGLGTRILSLLQEEYPRILRFTNSIFPSSDDDVVTSPYNAAFALNELREHADCVFPMDNQALIDICAASSPEKEQQGKDKVNRGVDRAKAFDDMNGVAAHMLSNLTSSARFHGKMNVDISELTTNLVPFPKMQFIVSSLSPLAPPRGNAHFADPATSSKLVDRTFANILSRNHQLLKTDPANGTFFACALLMRGNINLTDFNRNVARMSARLDLVPWNEQGFKVGHCSVPSVSHPHSLLCLSNNTCITSMFQEMDNRFRMLYGGRKRAFVHHYTQYVEQDQFDHILDVLQALQQDYSDTFASSSIATTQEHRRLKIF